MPDAPDRRPLRVLLVALALATLTGCLPGPRRARRPAPLPRDSAALLARALRQARPAFATHEEALRSGVYRTPRDTPPAPAPASAPAPKPEPPRPLPPPGATRPATPRPETALFVVQVAAFRDARSAEISAGEARSAFPDLAVLVESSTELHRVVLAGWGSAEAATAELPRIRARYPSAWVRARALP